MPNGRLTSMYGVYYGIDPGDTNLLLDLVFERDPRIQAAKKAKLDFYRGPVDYEGQVFCLALGRRINLLGGPEGRTADVITDAGMRKLTSGLDARLKKGGFREKPAFHFIYEPGSGYRDFRFDPIRYDLPFMKAHLHQLGLDFRHNTKHDRYELTLHDVSFRFPPPGRAFTAGSMGCDDLWDRKRGMDTSVLVFQALRNEMTLTPEEEQVRKRARKNHKSKLTNRIKKLFGADI